MLKPKEGGSLKGYQIPNSQFCTQKCDYCHGLGQASEHKLLDQICQSYLKAKNAGYEKVIFPCNTLFRSDWKDILESSRNSGMKTVLQIHLRYLNPRLHGLLHAQSKLGCEFQVVLDELNEEKLQFVEQFYSNFPDSSYLLVLRENLNVLPVVSMLPEEILERTYLYAPLKLETKDPFLTTNEVYELLNELEKKYPTWKNRSYPGIDVYDSRIASHTQLEPVIESQQLSKTEKFNPLFSVIIPTYNNKNYVRNTLRHLLEQSLEKDLFEVIIVDDGSDDETMKAICGDLENRDEEVNVQYIYFPRRESRVMGDGDFRAGIARNLGVKYSTGEYLCFLDSDILTPPNFLEQLLEELQHSDVIQAKRIYLKEEVSSNLTNYCEINKETDTYIPEGGYWHNFYSDPRPWNIQPNKWKFVCTYTLVLKKKLFCETGWFRKNYHYYGFEDTDLGYRLVKIGAKLYLSELEVLHLFHEDKRSEYRNSDFHRHMLLKKTAKLFFMNNLETDIYKALPNLVSEQGMFISLAKKVTRKFKSYTRV